ncbi:MAG: phage portal protein [Clostridia bacterium]
MDIKTFLKPCEFTKEIEISSRFTAENEEISKFTIKSITEIENETIKMQCLDKNGNLNRQKYLSTLVCKCVVNPNLSNSELQAYYSVLGEEKLIKTMLLSGEYASLVVEIQKICRFNEDFFENIDFIKN